MAESKALVPVEQKEVEFYEDTIVAVRLADGNVWYCQVNQHQSGFYAII